MVKLKFSCFEGTMGMGDISYLLVKIGHFVFSRQSRFINVTVGTALCLFCTRYSLCFLEQTLSMLLMHRECKVLAWLLNGQNFLMTFPMYCPGSTK